jgi:hypothetical protein
MPKNVGKSRGYKGTGMREMPIKSGEVRRGRGRPVSTGINPTISIRWPKVLMAGVESYARLQAIDRNSALKQIVAKYLIAEGVLSSDIFPLRSAQEPNVR